MKANDIQIDGDHYKKLKYQPWDLVGDFRLCFYLGNAVKYIKRHSDKNGVIDLEKALHYLDKFQEKQTPFKRVIQFFKVMMYNEDKLDLFISQLSYTESSIFLNIVFYDIDAAKRTLKETIELKKGEQL